MKSGQLLSPRKSLNFDFNFLTFSFSIPRDCLPIRNKFFIADLLVSDLKLSGYKIWKDDYSIWNSLSSSLLHGLTSDSSTYSFDDSSSVSSSSEDSLHKLASPFFFFYSPSILFTCLSCKYFSRIRIFMYFSFFSISYFSFSYLQSCSRFLS